MLPRSWVTTLGADPASHPLGLHRQPHRGQAWPGQRAHDVDSLITQGASRRRSHHFHVVTAQHAKIQRAQVLKPRGRQTPQMLKQVSIDVLDDARGVEVQLVLQQAPLWLGPASTGYCTTR